MAKKKKNPTQPTSFWIGFAKIFETLVDKFGWPGVIVIFVMYMIEYRATDEQRHAIIDMYLLGRGMQFAYPWIVMGGLFLCVLLAQRYWYGKKLKLMEAEIARIGGEKSIQQEKALGVTLQHSSLPEGNG